ncbi:hypothetical protein LCGC14_2444890 [marine sediment metagenome]|uniref:Uncharacterized protein n=1 Tax=marine sediment metagenome TaxID=412755 RepID=A0A0F9BHZ7_9ZZZZ
MTFPDPVTWTPLGLSFDLFASLTVLGICAFFYLAIRWLSELVATGGAILLALLACIVELIDWSILLLVVMTLLGLLAFSGYWRSRGHQ